MTTTQNVHPPRHVNSAELRIVCAALPAALVIDTNANEIGKDLIYIDTNRIYRGAGTAFEGKSRTYRMNVQGLTRAIIIPECTSKNRSVSLLI